MPPGAWIEHITHTERARARGRGKGNAQAYLLLLLGLAGAVGGRRWSLGRLLPVLLPLPLPLLLPLLPPGLLRLAELHHGVLAGLLVAGGHLQQVSSAEEHASSLEPRAAIASCLSEWATVMRIEPGTFCRIVKGASKRGSASPFHRYSVPGYGIYPSQPAARAEPTSHAALAHPLTSHPAPFLFFAVPIRFHRIVAVVVSIFLFQGTVFLRPLCLSSFTV